MRLVKQVLQLHRYVNTVTNETLTVSVSRLENGPVFIVECSEEGHEPDFFDNAGDADKQFGLILDNELTSDYQLITRLA